MQPRTFNAEMGSVRGELNSYPPDWSFLDGLYCISFQSRGDRTASVTRELHRVGRCRHTTFYHPLKHPKSPKIGVWESHRALARHGADLAWEKVLMLEDDVVFPRDISVRTTTAIKRTMQRLPADWMAFYLGHWVLWMSPRGGRLMRSGSLCTHAYVASPRLMRWLDQHPFSKDLARVTIAGKGIDAAYPALPGMYSLFPMIAVQDASPSDHMTPQKKRSKLSDFVSNSRCRNQRLSGLMRPNEAVVFLLTPLILLGRGTAGLFTRTRTDRQAP